MERSEIQEAGLPQIPLRRIWATSLCFGEFERVSSGCKQR